MLNHSPKNKTQASFLKHETHHDLIPSSCVKREPLVPPAWPPGGSGLQQYQPVSGLQCTRLSRDSELLHLSIILPEILIQPLSVTHCSNLMNFNSASLLQLRQNILWKLFQDHTLIHRDDHSFSCVSSFFISMFKCNNKFTYHLK